MARFEMALLKQGTENKGNDYTVTAAVVSVVFEEGDEELRFPETYEGLPVTHIGCKQGYREPHIEYGDWHHPTHRGDEYVEGWYFYEFNRIDVPPSVKRVYVHAAVDSFYVYGKEGTVFEVDPANKELAVGRDGQVTRKSWLHL